MPNMGRGMLIMKAAETRKAGPPGYEEPGEDGMGFASKAKGHCEEGLEMAREYLNGEEGQGSGLKPKVEALVAAYESLLSELNGGGEEEA